MESPAVWFPAIRTGTGTDTFTSRLVEGLRSRGIRAEIEWLPRRAEFFPWAIATPRTPAWANIAHINTWLHAKFIPDDLPFVATMHLCVHDRLLDPYKSAAQQAYHKFWIKKIERRVIERASRVVAVSSYTGQRTAEAFRVERVHTIYNGVATSGRWKARALDTNRPFRILYVGNWSRRKGADLLGPIMEMLGPGYELSYTADANGASKGARLPANCRCVGRLTSKQVTLAYLAADVLLFPSRLEGLPLSVIEAMATGLPVVSVARSSLPEVVVDGETGFLIAVDDVAGLANAVRRISKDATLLETMSRGARRRAEEMFSIDRMVEQYDNLYRQVLSAR